MSFSDSIKNYNYRFLDALKQGERVGLDSEGRLYTQKGYSKADFLFMALFHPGRQAELQEIGVEYGVDKFQFKEISKDEYLSIIERLSTSLLLNADQKALLAFTWYNRQYQSLLSQGMGESEAQKILNTEMALDPHIPPSFKKTLP